MCVLRHLQEGKTALHVAASKGHPQAVAELLAAGAPVDITTQVNKSAIRTKAVCVQLHMCAEVVRCPGAWVGHTVGDQGGPSGCRRVGPGQGAGTPVGKPHRFGARFSMSGW